jgi:hypothetical protein
MTMSHRARVRNGRLILNEPTDLPEGTEVDLVHTDEGEGPVDLSPAELIELDSRIAESKSGKLVEAAALFVEMRARK